MLNRNKLVLQMQAKERSEKKKKEKKQSKVRDTGRNRLVLEMQGKPAPKRVPLPRDRSGDLSQSKRQDVTVIDTSAPVSSADKKIIKD